MPDSRSGGDDVPKRFTSARISIVLQFPRPLEEHEARTFIHETIAELFTAYDAIDVDLGDADFTDSD